MAQGILSELFGPAELHALGILAAALVILSLVYTVKRNVPSFPGSSAFWLRVHKWGALLATVLAVLHTDLYFFGLALLTTALMLAQAATGAVGALIMRRLPQGEAGAEREIERMGRELEKARRTGAEAGEIAKRDAVLGRARRQWALLSKWRMIHVPLAVFFFGTLIVHVISVYYF